MRFLFIKNTVHYVTLYTIFSISGLSKMHILTSAKARPVRFRAWLWNGIEYTFQFDAFQVLDSSTNYKLRLDNFNVSASSAVTNQQMCIDQFTVNSNQKFSTKDRDNDVDDSRHCAQFFGGAGYWYERCTSVSPNVEYCPSSSCGSNVENIKIECLKEISYSMKKFQIDVFVM